VSLSRANTKPINAKLIPTQCVLCNLSFRNNLANRTITTISSGPATRSSFDAPILFTESYHVSIPIASDNDARISILVDSVNSAIMVLFFLKIRTAVSNNNIPAKVMLVEESTRGEIWIEEEVKYSMIMDSTEIAIAYTKTTQDFRINKVGANF
jgi:hypothetical protein